MSSGVCMQRLIQSMDSMSLDAFIYPGWGNPPRLIGDLSQAGHTVLGAPLMTPHDHPALHHDPFHINQTFCAELPCLDHLLLITMQLHPLMHTS